MSASDLIAQLRRRKEGTMILQIAPPLPCGALGPDGRQRCGTMASVATADAMGGGQYIMLPLCKRCVAALAQIYGVADTGATPATENKDAP